MDPTTKTSPTAPSLEPLVSSSVVTGGQPQPSPDPPVVETGPPAEVEAPELYYAGFRPRWQAQALDALLVAPLGYAMEKLAAAFPGAGPWVMAGGTALVFAYVIYLTGRYGRTLGKWAMGLQVRQEDGSPVTWKAAWLRSAPLLAIMLLASAAGLEPGENWLDQESLWALPPTLLLLAWVLGEVITFVRSDRRQALHDVVADTVVVHD